MINIESLDKEMYVIGSKKITKSIKEYKCNKCGDTISKNSTYHRVFMGKKSNRCELFICDDCAKNNKVILIK